MHSISGCLCDCKRFIRAFFFRPYTALVECHFSCNNYTRLPCFFFAKRVFPKINFYGFSVNSRIILFVLLKLQVCSFQFTKNFKLHCTIVQYVISLTKIYHSSFNKNPYSQRIKIFVCLCKTDRKRDFWSNLIFFCLSIVHEAIPNHLQSVPCQALQTLYFSQRVK